MIQVELLVGVAHVTHSSDDEDEDEDDEAEGSSKDESEGKDKGEEGGDKVKPDPDGPAKKAPQQLHEYTPEELAPLKKAALIADVELLDGKITSIYITILLTLFVPEKIKRSNPDLSVLKEYKRRQAEFDNRARELEEVTQARDEQKAKYDDLRKKRLDEFMTGFALISAKLKEMYQASTCCARLTFSS